ncbi:MAG: septal ring lytic transglycosylase RlpA family protein [SAR324 cluster bacterium]|nr:septal ring lytic transglycosylase RlpA family protein [SAR324 cluster bacterium]
MKLQKYIYLVLGSAIIAGCSPIGNKVAQKETNFHTPQNWEKPVDLNATGAVGFQPDFSGQKDAVATNESELGFRPLFSGEEQHANEPTFAPVKGGGQHEQMQGHASWYGPGFHGKKTANGEDYDQMGMTAAHKILPMNTWVRVTNQENGKSAVVRINDRGPYKDDRIIDLTKTAAKRIGSFEQGTASVKLEVLKYPKNYDASKGLTPYKQTVVQVAVFRDQQRAENFKSQLTEKFNRVAFLVDTPEEGSYHVVAGPFDERDQAKSTARRLNSRGFGHFVRSYRK